VLQHGGVSGGAGPRLHQDQPVPPRQAGRRQVGLAPRLKVVYNEKYEGSVDSVTVFRIRIRIGSGFSQSSENKTLFQHLKT
jgi:hypothetical protein